jgi:monovalent cation:H+ antiporter-2, CPA2 family
VVPVRDLFATLFFVSVGMMIDVRFIADNWALVLGIAAFGLVLKGLATFIGVLPFRVSARHGVHHPGHDPVG